MQSVPAKAGRTYQFEAYVRTDPNDGSGTRATSAQCELKVFDGFNAIQQVNGTQIGLTATANWAKCTASLTVNVDAGAGKNVQAIVNGLPGNRCFLVDDASLIEQP